MSDRDPLTVSIAQMVEIVKRYREARELRLSTGMWLRATELRLRDADQMPAFMEHVDRSPEQWSPWAGSAALLSSIPVVYDDTVPVGMVAIALEDGSVKMLPLV